MPILACAAWAGVAGAASLVTYPIARACRFKPLVALLLAAAGAGLALAGLLLCRATFSPRPVSVTITSPRNLGVVKGPVLQVDGIVGWPRARVTLAVRSEKDLYWWIQPVVTAEPADGGTGRWAVTANIGTKKEGVRETFYIVALASRDSMVYDLLSGHWLGEDIRSPTVPVWGGQSDSLIVWRAE